MFKRRGKMKIGIVGCGAIGEGVATFIDRELKKKVILWGICDKDSEKAEFLAEKLSVVPRISTLNELARRVDLIIEAASVDAALDVLHAAIKLKKDVVILSVGSFIKNKKIIQKAAKNNINIYVPSGAICGVDALGALSLGEIKKVSLVTSKPPRGLAGVAYLKNKRIDLTNIKKEKVVFRGKVKDAIRYFPQNINVAAILLLASSFKGVEVVIKADPHVERNIHRIEIDTEDARIKISVENVPSKINPKTSSLAILSTQNLLKKLFSSFKIGS